MRRKLLAIVLILSHLLCILFGYSLGSMKMGALNSEDLKRQAVESKEMAEDSSNLKEINGESKDTAEEINETTEETEENKKTMENDEEVTESTSSNLDYGSKQSDETTALPTETAPSVTEPSVTVPPTTSFPGQEDAFEGDLDLS